MTNTIFNWDLTHQGSNRTAGALADSTLSAIIKMRLGR